MVIHTIYHRKTQKLQNNSPIEFKNKLKLQNRMEIEPLIKKPTTLTFVTTEKCSSACSSCCFQCSPKRSKRLTKEQMVGYMEQVKRDFPTVISLVLTGGECTLLPELVEIINVATNHGYFVS